jgi:hypothetical protein
MRLIRASREMCQQCRIDESKPPVDTRVYEDEHGRYRRLRLTQEQYALVDEADYEELSALNWLAHYSPNSDTFYAMRREPTGTPYRQRTIQMHGVIVGVDGCRDHADRNGLNNRRYNLRPADASQNGCNRRTRRNSKTGFKGVTWHRDSQVYRVRITVRGKTIQLGTATDPRAGAIRYNEAALKYHGEFARLNVV